MSDVGLSRWSRRRSDTLFFCWSQKELRTGITHDQWPPDGHFRFCIKKGGGPWTVREGVKSKARIFCSLAALWFVLPPTAEANPTEGGGQGSGREHLEDASFIQSYPPLRINPTKGQPNQWLPEGKSLRNFLTFFQRHFRANLLSLGKGQLVRSNIYPPFCCSLIRETYILYKRIILRIIFII